MSYKDLWVDLNKQPQGHIEDLWNEFGFWNEKKGFVENFM